MFLIRAETGTRITNRERAAPALNWWQVAVVTQRHFFLPREDGFDQVHYTILKMRG